MSGAGAVVGGRGFEPEFQRVFCTDVVKLRVEQRTLCVRGIAHCLLLLCSDVARPLLRGGTGCVS
jgi:hypothetical protein